MVLENPLQHLSITVIDVDPINLLLSSDNAPWTEIALFLSLPFPDRAVYELYTVYIHTLSDAHTDHLFLFMRLGEWNASLCCLDFILSLSPKKQSL